MMFAKLKIVTIKHNLFIIYIKVIKILVAKFVKIYIVQNKQKMVYTKNMVLKMCFN